MKEIQKKAFVNSLLTSLYIVAVGLFLYYGTLIKLGRVNSFLAPITLLFLFVFSAALTSFLLLGKPAQMYIDGKKKEALSLITYTLGFFFAFTLIALLLLIFLAH
jgi:hypothetical protein